MIQGSLLDKIMLTEVTLVGGGRENFPIKVESLEIHAPTFS